MQYEVSAYAQQGARCRHNLNYWLFGDYVGLGAGAHGKLSLSVPDRILRTAKPKQPRDYQARLDAWSSSAGPATIGERTFVAPVDLPFEVMVHALRLNEGFGTCDFEHRTGLPISRAEPALRKAGERGLIEVTARGWRPSELGRRFLNDLQAGFLA